MLNEAGYGGGEEKAEGESSSRELTFTRIEQADQAGKNLVTLLDDEEIAEVGHKVVSEYRIDHQSLDTWRKRYDEAIDLAMMVAEEKTHPWVGASNVKYPLVATAALQFNARAYPAMVPPDRIVKCRSFGQDPDGSKASRADRVAEHMSWQLTEQMPEWEEDSDRLTLMVSILGTMFRKCWYDPSLRRNVTRLVPPHRLVINYQGRSFDDVPRKTELLSLYPYEINERIRDGRFVAFEYDKAPKGEAEDEKAKDTSGEEDKDGPHTFLEQHRLLDLDDDGYAEPYIVTVHLGTEQVCRIKANWDPDKKVVNGDKVVSLRPQCYYVRYPFLPAPDSAIYGLGFGWLLSDTNEAINTALNQMFDAGGLQNMQGGFVSSMLGLKDKTIRLERGEWRIVNSVGPIAQAIQPIKYDGPSTVLMQLLTFLVEAGKELASVKDVLTGETPATAPVGTTLALIEQGLQVFTSIYKRLHRSLKKELGLLADLNRRFLDPQQYAQFTDGQQPADPQADYADDMAIVPFSDPQSVTKAQKIAKAQAVFGLAQNNPTMNPAEATRRVLDALDVEEPDKLMVPPPQPDPAKEDLARRAAEAEVAEKEASAEQKAADATNKLATGLLTMEQVAAMNTQQIVGQVEMLLKMLTTQHGMEMDVAGQQAIGPGGVPGVGQQPGDAMGAGAAPDAGAGPGGLPAGLPLQPAQQPGMGQPAGGVGVSAGAL